MNNKKQNLSYSVPLPIQIVIDDVGWWSGENGSEKQEPYRTGFIRNHVPADYQAIIDLGKNLNMRPQAAMVLGEWDKQDDLASIPSCSKFGDQWSNKKWVGPWLEEASKILQENKEYIELTLHGINHEYWSGNTFTRGEWYDKSGRIRPKEECLQRLELFRKLMETNQLGNFPESYVPTAFVHHFSPKGENLFEIFQQKGIKYVSTPFSTMINSENVPHQYFGIDHGIITIDRGQDILPWFQFNKPLEKEVIGPICGMHWPNLLHEDPDKNNETVDRWVIHLNKYRHKIDRMLSKNTKEMCTQLVYHELTSLKLESNQLQISIGNISNELKSILNNRFFIKLQANSEASFGVKNLKIINQQYNKSGQFFEFEIEPLGNNCVVTIN